MRQLPPSRASSGYTPNRLNPLAVAPVADQGERLTELQAIQRLFAKGENGGYWPADPAFLYEDSAGTTAASLNGVIGLRVNRISGLPNGSQATTANKPYLRRTPVSNKTWLDSNTSSGALTATFASSLGSACTIATVGAEGVTILENQTVGTTYNITPAYGYNGDVLIINRALTVAEKALVTRVLSRNVPTLGSELVTNGGFENGTNGWTADDANISVVDGKLRVVTIVDYGRVVHAITIIINGMYRITASVTNISGNNANSVHISALSNGGGVPIIGNTGTGNRNVTLLYYAATSATRYLILQNNYPGASTHDFDNVSCKAIL